MRWSWLCSPELDQCSAARVASGGNDPSAAIASCASLASRSAARAARLRRGNRRRGRPRHQKALRRGSARRAAATRTRTVRDCASARCARQGWLGPNRRAPGRSSPARFSTRLPTPTLHPPRARARSGSVDSVRAMLAQPRRPAVRDAARRGLPPRSPTSPARQALPERARDGDRGLGNRATGEAAAKRASPHRQSMSPTRSDAGRTSQRSRRPSFR